MSETPVPTPQAEAGREMSASDDLASSGDRPQQALPLPAQQPSEQNQDHVEPTRPTVASPTSLQMSLNGESVSISLLFTPQVQAPAAKNASEPQEQVAPIVKQKLEVPPSNSFTASITTLFGLATLLLGLAGAIFLYYSDIHHATRIPVPKEDVRAYEIITQEALAYKEYSDRDLVREDYALVATGRYALADLAAGQPIDSNLLGPIIEAGLIANTVPIAIPFNADLVVAGNLRAGDLVDLVIVPASLEGQPAQEPLIFMNTLVLNATPVGHVTPDGADGAQDNGEVSRVSAHPFNVVLALTKEERVQFAAASTNSTIFITPLNE